MRIGVQKRLVTPQPVDYGVVRSLCTALCGRYTILRPAVIGHSVLGREIPALMLSAGGEGQPVLLAAAFHGQEWLTALCALRLCEELCAAQRAHLPLCGVPVHRALRDRQIWFVPLVNPDGVEIARYGSIASGLDELSDIALTLTLHSDPSVIEAAQKLLTHLNIMKGKVTDGI